jgi:hypothetical protein
MSWRDRLQDHFIDSSYDWINHGIADSVNYETVGHGFDLVLLLRNCRHDRWSVQEMMKNMPIGGNKFAVFGRIGYDARKVWCGLC